MKEAFVKYDYAEIILDSKRPYIKVSSGGEVINGKYVGGKWGVDVYEDIENVFLPVKYDYVGNVIWYADAENGDMFFEDSYYGFEVATEGYFDEDGAYCDGKYGLVFTKEMVIDYKYGYISDAAIGKAIVANNGERLNDGSYKNGKWGIVELYTGREVATLKYDFIDKFRVRIMEDYEYVVNFPYLKFRLNDKWGLLNSQNGEEIEKAEYSENEIDELLEKYETQYIESL